MADKGVFQFPTDIEQGPTTYQEFKFLTLWEAWGETGAWEVTSDAARLAEDDAERNALSARVLRELRGEGLIEVVRANPPHVQDAPALADSEFEQEIASGRLWSFSPDQPNVHLRWTHKAEQWRETYERG
jgi:methylase of polypeptide subunit release factors